MVSVVGYLYSLTSAEHSISHPILVLWLWVTGQLGWRWRLVVRGSGVPVRLTRFLQTGRISPDYNACTQPLAIGSSFAHYFFPLIPAEFTSDHMTNMVTDNLSLFNNITSHHIIIQNLLTPFCDLSSRALMTSSTTCDFKTWSLVSWLPTGESWWLSLQSPPCITSIYQDFILMVNRRMEYDFNELYSQVRDCNGWVNR